MKKHYLAALAVTAILGLGASGTALAATSEVSTLPDPYTGSTFLDGSGIVGSPHDFTDNMIFGKAVVDGEAWNFRKEICRVCHSPHDKQRTAYKAGLLWNRNLSSADYTPYTFSEKANNPKGGATGQPEGRAKMCLSCHDNTVALGQFDTYADNGVNPEDGADIATTATMQDIYADGHFMIGNNSLNGRSLEGTHPISVLFSLGYNLKPVTSEMGPYSGQIKDVLDNGMVQCSSCHDVHNRVSVPGTHLLRVAQTVKSGGTASGLCLTCHDK